MRHRAPLNEIVREQTVAHGGKLSLQRLLAFVGLGLGLVVLAVAVVLLMFGQAILNGYGKGKIERAFAAACPGYSLRIAGLDYAPGADRLTGQSVIVSASNATLRVSRLSLTGVRWAPLLRGKGAPAEVLAKGSLEATDLELELPQAHYRVRCARLRASVPDSELIVEGIELRPLVGDEDLFASDTFRTTRFRVVVPECRVLGLAYGELLRGASYRAKSIHFVRPSFDALVNCDKSLKPFVKSPLMVHEALASIRRPLQVESLSITNGSLRYGERLVAGAEPGVLTFGNVGISVAGIGNRTTSPAVISLQAQGDFMEAGTLKVVMSIPITPLDLSLHYSGSLTAMDLTRLDPFLDIAEHVRITSGHAEEAAFEIDVTAGHARGRVRAIYEHLEIALLDKQTGTATGLDHRVASFLANVWKIRSSNARDASGFSKEGKVDYTRKPEEEFLQFLWFALRTGVQDVISL